MPPKAKDMDVAEANRAIDEGRLTVTKVPPAYVGIVNGAKPLAQPVRDDNFKSVWSPAHKMARTRAVLNAAKRTKVRNYMPRLAIREALQANPGTTVSKLAQILGSDTTTVGNLLRFDRDHDLAWSTDNKPQHWYSGPKPK